MPVVSFQGTISYPFLSIKCLERKVLCHFSDVRGHQKSLFNWNIIAGWNAQNSANLLGKSPTSQLYVSKTHDNICFSCPGQDTREFILLQKFLVCFLTSRWSGWQKTISRIFTILLLQWINEYTREMERLMLLLRSYMASKRSQTHQSLQSVAKKDNFYEERIFIIQYLGSWTVCFVHMEQIHSTTHHF